ncbi:MAG: Bax inhibitor-1/YccA family protein [Acidimicrobiia bacterium]
MSNPVLTERAFEQERAGGPGWAAPGTGIYVNAPAPESMTIAGTATAVGALFAIFLVAAWFGWNAVSESTVGNVTTTSAPSWLLVAIIGGFIVALVSSRKPKLARVLGPIYAICQGAGVGVISHIYDVRYEGIVLQAVGATIGVFAVMWFLYATRVIKVTDRMRMIVTSATAGLALFYVVSIVLHAVGVGVPFLNSPSPLGIAFSLFAAGLAAFNLTLDFDLIERSTKAGAPKYMEWYAGLGLVITIVWLYLELLRLLSKRR